MICKWSVINFLFLSPESDSDIGTPSNPRATQNIGISCHLNQAVDLVFYREICVYFFVKRCFAYTALRSLNDFQKLFVIRLTGMSRFLKFTSENSGGVEAIKFIFDSLNLLSREEREHFLLFFDVGALLVHASSLSLQFLLGFLGPVEEWLLNENFTSIKN